MHALHITNDSSEEETLTQLYSQVIQSIYREVKAYLEEFRQSWSQTPHGLFRMIDDSASIITYPIHCLRILELAGLLYFLENDQQAKEETSDFIQEFIAKEVGCGHVVADRFAVSLVPPILALCQSGRHDVAQGLLHQATVWLCDRYEKGAGLASIEASPDEEVATLLGFAFKDIAVRPRRQSFAATVLSDLIAFLGDASLYSNVVNDIEATGILPQYWQPIDTLGQFFIHSEDVVYYPNVRYAPDHTPFEMGQFAQHIQLEPQTFKVADKVGGVGYLTLTLLLRDRYFPSLWLRLVASHTS